MRTMPNPFFFLSCILLTVIFNDVFAQTLFFLSCILLTAMINYSVLSPPFLFLQTILVGDSGVGKTSLLVQFDQGKFQAGSFSATVGIGFTVGQPSLGAPSHRIYR